LRDGAVEQRQVDPGVGDRAGERTSGRAPRPASASAGTRWQERPNDEFAALHDAALAEQCWVIEGNYSSLVGPRLARATGFILLDLSSIESLARYLRRTWGTAERVGGLESNDTVSWGMIRYILGNGRARRAHYRQLFDEFPRSKLSLPSRRALRSFYREQSLSR
jgi:hypothetical protein